MPKKTTTISPLPSSRLKHLHLIKRNASSTLHRKATPSPPSLAFSGSCPTNSPFGTISTFGQNCAQICICKSSSTNHSTMPISATSPKATCASSSKDRPSTKKSSTQSARQTQKPPPRQNPPAPTSSIIPSPKAIPSQRSPKNTAYPSIPSSNSTR